VTALNVIGESQPSSKLQSFIAIVPSTPPSLDMVVSGEGTVQLAWEVPENDGGATLLGYYIYYK